MAKDAVFPLPVFDFTIISFLFNKKGITSSCTFEGSSYFILFNDFIIFLSKLNFSNLLTMIVSLFLTLISIIITYLNLYKTKVSIN